MGKSEIAENPKSHSLNNSLPIPLSDNSFSESNQQNQHNKPEKSEAILALNSDNKMKKNSGGKFAGHKLGLPGGFIPRKQRCEQTILLAENIYRLPDGKELVPCRPSGTLGHPGHLYALVTAEQYLQRKRGSIYIRRDGKVFDYSVDHCDPNRELFDTGYTIRDLERTGRYVREEANRSQTSAVVEETLAASAT